MSDTTINESSPQLLDRVVIRFAGDSGDGMQLAGDRFTTSSALFGNDLATFPDFPAEIRAPAGTLAGVSAFQVHISDHDILTPGDDPNVLVAMNPAALKANTATLPPGATLIVNVDAFDERNLAKAGYDANPLGDGTLSAYTVYEVPMTSITTEVCKEAGVKPRDAERSKNFFALGLISWLYTRPTEPTEEWIEKRFSSKPMVKEANLRAFKAGFHFGETAELFESSYEVRPAELEPGEYVNITGNTAAAWGLIAAATQSGLPLFLGTYPITPASDILHELSKHKQFGVRTFQAEDEIAGVGAALGAAFGGGLGVTTTSGPRRRPQGRDGRVGRQSGAAPGDHRHPARRSLDRLAHQDRTGRFAPCHVRASRRGAVAHRGRDDAVALLRGHRRGGALGGEVPDAGHAPVRRVLGQRHRTVAPARSGRPTRDRPGVRDGPTTPVPRGETFWPYIRDEETLARPWAPPGVPGLEHRIGGLEKADGSGNVAYDGANHERMSRLRAARIAGIAHDIPLLDVDDVDADAKVLVVGWGSTYGAIAAGVRRIRARGQKVAHAQLVHLNPFPSNLEAVLKSYDKVLVPEVNLGQLNKLLRAEFLVDVVSFTKLQGLPFRAAEIEAAILQEISEIGDDVEAHDVAVNAGNGAGNGKVTD